MLPHFTYGNCLLHGVTQKLRTAPKTHQNSAIRAVRNVDMSYSTNRAYIKLGLERIDTISKKATIMLVYKEFSGIGSCYLNEAFREY